MSTIIKKLIENDTILIREFKYDPNEEITISSYIQGTRDDIESGLINDRLIGVILDFREIKYSIPVDDFHLLKDFLAKASKIFPKHKVAIVSENPASVLAAYKLESKNNKNPDIQLVKVFSTIHEAVTWVKKNA